MLKSQCFLNYVPEASPADILLISQNIENTAKCRRLMMQGTVAVNTGDENNPPPQRSYFTPCAAVHHINKPSPKTCMERKH